MKAKYIFLNIYVSQKKRTFEKKKKKNLNTNVIVLNYLRNLRTEEK